MLQKQLLVLSLVFCAQQVFAVREMPGSAGKSLLQFVSLSVGTNAAGTGSSAVASGSAVVSGPGTVAVKAESRAQEFSVTEARDLFAAAIASAVAEVQSGGDAISLADFAALTFAEAIAKAFTEATSVRVVSTGDGGSACGQATISPDKAARAAAESLVQVLSQASISNLFAAPSAAVEAIVAVTVGAFDSAQKKLCVNGANQASSSSSELASAIKIPYAQVTAMALALVIQGAVPVQIRVSVVDGSLVVLTVDLRAQVAIIPPRDG